MEIFEEPNYLTAKENGEQTYFSVYFPCTENPDHVSKVGGYTVRITETLSCKKCTSAEEVKRLEKKHKAKQREKRREEIAAASAEDHLISYKDIPEYNKALPIYNTLGALLITSPYVIKQVCIIPVYKDENGDKTDIANIKSYIIKEPPIILDKHFRNTNKQLVHLHRYVPFKIFKSEAEKAGIEIYYCPDRHIWRYVSSGESVIRNFDTLETLQLKIEEAEKKYAAYFFSGARSRKQAKENNIPVYHTGVRCKNGHFSPRTTHDGKCMQCNSPAKFYKRTTREYAHASYKNKKYFDGLPCPTCGRIRVKDVKTGKCLTCMNNSNMEKHASNDDNAIGTSRENVREIGTSRENVREIGTSRENARELGLKRYRRRYPCKFHHEPVFYTSNGSCCACVSERREKTRKKHVNVKNHVKNGTGKFFESSTGQTYGFKTSNIRVLPFKYGFSIPVPVEYYDNKIMSHTPMFATKYVREEELEELDYYAYGLNPYEAKRPVDYDPEKWAEFMDYTEKLLNSYKTPKRVGSRPDGFLRTMNGVALKNMIHMLHVVNDLPQVVPELLTTYEPIFYNRKTEEITYKQCHACGTFAPHSFSMKILGSRGWTSCTTCAKIFKKNVELFKDEIIAAGYGGDESFIYKDHHKCRFGVDFANLDKHYESMLSAPITGIFMNIKHWGQTIDKLYHGLPDYEYKMPNTSNGMRELVDKYMKTM
jgi:hypothetical protein